MARTMKISSIDAEIAKTEANLAKAQNRVDALSAKLLALQKKRQEYEMNRIMEAYRQSGKTFDEVMIFLSV